VVTPLYSEPRIINSPQKGETRVRDRVARLSARLAATGPDGRGLVLAALDAALASHASRTLGRAVIAGEIAPSDWEPRTFAELWASLDDLIELLGVCLHDPTSRDVAFGVLARHGRSLLQAGRHPALRRVLDDLVLDERQRVTLLGFVDDFIGYDAGQPDDENSYPIAYVNAVRTWRTDLTRHDLGGRLAEMISPPFARRQLNEKDAWVAEVRALGAELHGSHEELEHQLPSLLAEGQNGAALFELGRCLGSLDEGAIHLVNFLSAGATAPNTLFLRGYVFGLGERGPEHDLALRDGLDNLERLNPTLAVDLNEMNTRVGSAGARAIRLVREQRLKPEMLAHAFSLQRDSKLLADALETILELMPDRMEDAAAAALRLLAPIAWGSAVLPSDNRSIELMWRVLEAGVAGAHGEAHTWGRLLKRLGEAETYLARAATTACRAVIQGDLSVQEEAVRELSASIAREPKSCLAVIGPMLLALENSAAFAFGQRGAVFGAFPVELLKQWLLDNGAIAARLVAGHLPAPRVEPDGTAIVPSLTEFVLREFEADDAVFSAFCMNMHFGRVYFGDISGEKEAEADVATRFRSHELRRIREWAEREFHSARHDARSWDELFEERHDQ
jgi:hypothetical protein